MEPTSDSKVDISSKELRWYYKDIDGHLAPVSRKLLEEYSHIPAQDVDSHVYKLRDILWSLAPYPCIGEFKFLTLNLPKHPQYAHLLSVLQPSPAAPGPYLLDLGCCVAQELRSLTHAGIPSQNLYGSDLIHAYLTTSYDLFNDKDTFTGTLVQANIFSPELFEKEFHGWEAKFKVVHAGLFLHLFTWDQQVAVCEKIVKLLSDEEGAMFLGEMLGCKGGGERALTTVDKKLFLHDEGTFERLWGEVAAKTGTKGRWKVESRFRVTPKEVIDKHEGQTIFVGEGIGWISFSVERV